MLAVMCPMACGEGYHELQNNYALGVDGSGSSPNLLRWVLHWQGHL